MFDPSRNYAILGLARSGIAAARKIRELGGTALLSEQKPFDQVPEAEALRRDFACEFGGHTDRLLDCDLWIVSPGIPLDSPVIRKGRDHGIEMISEIEFGFRVKAPDSRVIAVTGSNGKSTVASLIHHLLSATGHRSVLAGNIGDAWCGFPLERPGTGFYVLEISSFQLDLIHSFRPDVALLLNITPDHLNRYASYEDYILSKFRVFENQTALDTAVICVDSEPVASRRGMIPAKVKSYSLEQVPPACDAWLDGRDIRIGSSLLSVHELKIRGPHNWANTMAALLAVQAATGDLDAAMAAAKTYIALAHRLEYVATVNGVAFYNDSKATNTDSVRSALLSFDTPIRVILGGSDKGEDFSILTDLLRQKAKKLYITGATGSKMREAWEGRVPLVCVSNIEESIRTAFDDSKPGDIIVLSPACASYDSFRNFEHRGEFFKQIVARIAAEHEKS